MKTNLIIGTRQSLLALWQSNHIAARLREQYPECTVTLKKIITKGDRILDVPLAKIGGKGLFTKELETALLDGEIDLAVHSLKDMPTVLPEGLVPDGDHRTRQCRRCLCQQQICFYRSTASGSSPGHIKPAPQGPAFSGPSRSDHR